MSTYDRIVSTILFWILWSIGIIGMLCVTYDILFSHTLLLSQQLFLLCLFSLLPISYGYYSERQDVCS